MPSFFHGPMWTTTYEAFHIINQVQRGVNVSQLSHVGDSNATPDKSLFSPRFAQHVPTLRGGENNVFSWGEGYFSQHGLEIMGKIMGTKKFALILSLS